MNVGKIADSAPEFHLRMARHAVLGLMQFRFGNTEPHLPGDVYGGTTQLEQVLAEIHGTFAEEATR